MMMMTNIITITSIYIIMTMLELIFPVSLTTLIMGSQNNKMIQIFTITND